MDKVDSVAGLVVLDGTAAESVNGGGSDSCTAPNVGATVFGWGAAGAVVGFGAGAVGGVFVGLLIAGRHCIWPE